VKKINIDSESTVIEPAIYKRAGKNAISIAFNKVFDIDKTQLNIFRITKNAYCKNADDICRYANAFLKQYDHDKEFITALLNIKYQIDKPTIYYEYFQFISDVTEYLLSDTMIEKINRMVDDYYEIDLTPTDDIKDVDLHALQFTNEHGKILMALAIAYKLTIPVVCHYYAVNCEKMSEIAKLKGKKNIVIKDYIYNVFTNYLPLFQGNSNIYNKIASTVMSHLTGTRNSDKILWKRAENKKLTPTIYTDKLVAAVIVDLIPKAIFKKNLMFLIQVSIPKQIKTMLLGKDKWEWTDVSMAIRSDDLSGLEKMEASNARLSDLDTILSSLNINKTLSRIKREYNIEIDKDELRYYKENMKNFVFYEFILQFFVNDFGGIYDLKNISKKNFITLMIIFKKIMKKMGFFYLPQILTGNVSRTIKRRKVTTKQLRKIESSYKFRKMMKHYSMGMSIENNTILRNIALLINTPIEFVDYEYPDDYGNIIQVDNDIYRR
jgi:hypothetical protein